MVGIVYKPGINICFDSKLCVRGEKNCLCFSDHQTSYINILINATQPVLLKSDTISDMIVATMAVNN